MYYQRLLSGLPEGKVKKMVTTYFNNTARRWKNENDEAAGEKAKANETRTRRQVRKKRVRQPDSSTHFSI